MRDHNRDLCSAKDLKHGRRISKEVQAFLLSLEMQAPLFIIRELTKEKPCLSHWKKKDSETEGRKVAIQLWGGMES
jgi:hypothetical protein